MFIDANVLLEILLGRRHEAAARGLIISSVDELQISALTAPLIVHFGQAIVELPVMRHFLSDDTILDLESSDFQWAFTNIRGNDFEDALQLAVAIRNGVRHTILRVRPEPGNAIRGFSIYPSPICCLTSNNATCSCKFKTQSVINF